MAYPPAQPTPGLPPGYQLPPGVTLDQDGQPVDSNGQVVRGLTGLPAGWSVGQGGQFMGPGGAAAPPAGTMPAPAAAPTLANLYGNGTGYTDQTASLPQGGVGGFGMGPSVQGPDANAYDQQIAQAQNYAALYGGQANAALGNAAPQIAGLGQYSQEMGGLGNTYGQIAQGQGPAGQLAQNQFANALGQSVNSNTAMARSATGGAIGQAGAERAAVEANAATGAGAAGQSQINQGQMQLGALAGQQGAYGAQLQGNQAQANLQAGQNSANYSYAGNLQGLQNNAQQGGLASLNAYNAANNQAGGLQINSDIANANATQGQENSVMNLFSDADAKLVAAKEGAGDPGYAPRLADAFLRSIDPKHFKYKDPSLEPSPNPHGGDYLGIFAQDLEKAPSIGPQLVNRDARTGLKQVNIPSTTSALLAGVGRLNERLTALEGSTGHGLTSDESAKDPLPDEDDTEPPSGGEDAGLAAMTAGAPAGSGLSAAFLQSLRGSSNPILQQAAAPSVPSNALTNLPTANTANAVESSSTQQLGAAAGGQGQGDAAPKPNSGGLMAGLMSAAEAAGIAAMMAA